METNEVLERLERGNKEYIADRALTGDLSARRREELTTGQAPFAIVVACSDSRVIPEVIFNVGLGELFVIRVAGNILGDAQLASIEYAAHHLGVHTVVIMGHTACGAVTAAVGTEKGGLVDAVVLPIRKAIGLEKNIERAAMLNVLEQVAVCDHHFSSHGVHTVGAMYDIRTGVVDFFKR